MQAEATARPEGALGAIRWRGGPLPWQFWTALAAVFVGWFPCDTLATSVGPIRLHFHFFDLASLILRPARLFIGVNRGDAITLPFGILCLAVLGTTLAPRISRHRLAWLAPVLPLALMLICGALLYAVSSGDAFTVDQNAGSVPSVLARFGNALVGHASAVAARHVGIGFGAWLSLAACVYLAHGAAKGKWRSPQADRLPIPTTTSTTPAAIATPPTQGGTS
jgi:hypothetical protein